MNGIIVDNNKIRTSRQYRKYSLIDFAKAVGVSYAYMSHIELGSRLPSLKVLNDISEILEMPISEFILSTSSTASTINDEDVPYLPSSNIKCNGCDSSSFSICMHKQIKADYAVKINTDNLLPFIPNGSCIFIKENGIIKNGNPVLFQKDSEIYYSKKTTQKGIKGFEINQKFYTENELQNEGFTLIGKIIFVK